MSLLDAATSTPSIGQRALARGVGIAGAALGGFAILLWIAANWSILGRHGRFALVEGALVATMVGALLVPRWRPPLALVAMIAIGGLLALFGQAYQTGADAWQLFALWALLALPLCVAMRSDVLWAPWSLVAMAAVSLWITAHTGHRFRTDPNDFRAHGTGWIIAILVAAAASPRLSRYTGVGTWGGRAAATLAIVLVGAGALVASFGQLGSLQYAIGFVVLGVAALVFTLPETYDLYALSAASLALNVLAIAGIAHLMWSARSSDALGSLILIGLVSAALLAATVTVVLRVARLREHGVAR